MVDQKLSNAMNHSDKKLGIRDFLKKALFKKPAERQVSKEIKKRYTKRHNDDSLSCHSFHSMQQSVSDEE